jgi:hypothetical protein
LQYGTFRMLVTGAAEAETEERLLGVPRSIHLSYGRARGFPSGFVTRIRFLRLHEKATRAALHKDSENTVPSPLAPPPSVVP